MIGDAIKEANSKDIGVGIILRAPTGALLIEQLFSGQLLL